MKVFGTFLFVAFLAVALADRDQCPHPEDAGEEVVHERIALSAPQDGIETVEIDIADDIIHSRVVSCFTVVSSGEQGGPSVISFGKNRREGYSLLLATGLRAPLEAIVQAYIPGRGPEPVVREIPSRFF